MTMASAMCHKAERTRGEASLINFWIAERESPSSGVDAVRANNMAAVLLFLLKCGVGAGLAVPEISVEPYPAVRQKADPLRLQHRALRLRPAKGKARCQAAVAEYDPVAGNHAGGGVAVQRPAHDAGRAGTARQQGDLPVGGHPSRRDPQNGRVNSLVEMVRHGASSFRRGFGLSHYSTPPRGCREAPPGFCRRTRCGSRPGPQGRRPPAAAASAACGFRPSRNALRASCSRASARAAFCAAAPCIILPKAVE